MNKKYIGLCLAMAIILVSDTEAKGGSSRGGGGRSGGSRKSGGGWSFFGGGSKSSSSSGSKNGYSKSSSGNSHTGGWFKGFLHSSPHYYTYRPIYIGRSSHSTGSESMHMSTNNGAEQQPSVSSDVSEELNEKDATNYAVGYTISKALSNDFFSIFNVVNDISKLPKQINNEKLRTTTSTTTTTTEFPLSISPTYNDIKSQQSLETFSSSGTPHNESSISQKPTDDLYSTTNVFANHGIDLDLMDFLRLGNFPVPATELPKDDHSIPQKTIDDLYSSTNLAAKPKSDLDFTDFLKRLGIFPIPVTKLPKDDYTTPQKTIEDLYSSNLFAKHESDLDVMSFLGAFPKSVNEEPKNDHSNNLLS